METLKAGCLAYIDTFVGLVPCKVLSITKKRLFEYDPQSVKLTWCRVQVTDDHSGYKKGEIVEQLVSSFCPRKSVVGRHMLGIATHNIEIDNLL